jgi:hypothetical protein
VVPAAPRPPRPADYNAKDWCKAAEDNLRTLDCKRDDGTSWTTTPAGKPFSDVCLVAWNDQRDWNPDCVASISSCKDIEAAYHGDVCPIRNPDGTTVISGAKKR